MMLNLIKIKFLGGEASPPLPLDETLQVFMYISYTDRGIATYVLQRVHNGLEQRGEYPTLHNNIYILSPSYTLASKNTYGLLYPVYHDKNYLVLSIYIQLHVCVLFKGTPSMLVF